MADSHSTATPETTNAAPTANPPVRENQRAVEAEVEQGAIAGQRVMRSVGGGSPETPPEQFSGALGGLSGRSQAGMLRQLQRSYGNSYVGNVVQRKADGNGTCSECEKKDKEIQRKGEGDVSSVPDGFEAAMQRSGSGQPLDEGTRSFMESRFGQDFGEVKIHTDSAAAEASEAVRAQAFTTGRDIYFGRGRYQPQVTEGKGLLAHELTHVVQQTSSIQSKSTVSQPGDLHEQEADRVATQVMSEHHFISPANIDTTIGKQQFSSIIARKIDPSKAEPIKKELDSTFYVSNSTLEKLWAELGVDLPEAMYDDSPVTISLGKSGRPESYFDLWKRSINEGMSRTSAAKPLINAFANDTFMVAKGFLSSQLTRLENLQEELKRAADQNKTRSIPAQSSTGGVEDPNKLLSRNTTPKPLADARGLIDTATFLHFLQNWEDILKTAPVGMRRVDASNFLPQLGPPASGKTFEPFPNSPSSQQGAASRGVPVNLLPGVGLQPILFLPNVPIDKILESPNIDFIDRDAFKTIQQVYQDCLGKRSQFRELAQALMAEDANLAVLSDRGLLSQVSALSIHSDAQAGSTLANIAKDNAEAVKRFLNMLSTPGTVDWKALKPVYGYLLAGGSGGSKDWSNIRSRGFVENYFKEQDQAERDKAMLELAAHLLIGAATLVALLSPAAPLATAFLLATDAIAVGGAIKESNLADIKADVLSAGAAAQVVSKDDARQAREDAESKKTSMVVTILMTALPYLPSVAKGGSKVASAIGRELRWEKLAEKSTLLGAGPAIGDLVVDLTKAGVSSIARNRAGGILSLNEMVSKITGISRQLPWIKVGDSLRRAGDEKLLQAASKYGLSDYIRYHLLAPGLGREGYPIFLAPTTANQFANNHIEGFMRRFPESADVRFSIAYSLYSGEELKPFIKGMLESGSKDIINRLALDQGRIEGFLKGVTYDIRVKQGGSTSLYRANIAIGPPTSGAVTTQIPLLLP